MKELILSAAMIAGLGAVASQAAIAADGTITFNGNISSTTCSVHGGSVSAADGNFVVNLPEVSSASFSGGPGSVTGITDYSIYVGTEGDGMCPDGGQLVSPCGWANHPPSPSGVGSNRPGTHISWPSGFIQSL